MSCLGTWSPPHSLPLTGRGDTSTGSSRGWPWKNATCCQPCCTRGLGMSHCPAAAAGLTSPCPCSGPHGAKGGGRGHGSGPGRKGNGDNEGIPQLQPWGTVWITGPARRGAETMAGKRGAHPSAVESRLAHPGDEKHNPEGNSVPVILQTHIVSPGS